MAPPTDTIAALATPAGTAALSVLRITGPDTQALAAAALGAPLSPRRAHRRDYRATDGGVIDEVLATYFPGPRSYSGEDLLEISTHGNPFIVQRVLADLLRRGCRAAGPGEFTQRAFLNGRIDLSQAEAVMDIIQARSERALSAAQGQLRGALGRELSGLIERLVQVTAAVEGQIDFPEDDLPPEDRAALLASLDWVEAGARRLLATRRYGELLRDGIVTVIVGAPNAGKSSLLNRLVGADRALVSPEPGTTRDYVEERVILGPHSFRLVDTAGLNPVPGAVERLGMAKTLEQALRADLLIVVLDANRPTPAFTRELADRFEPEKTLVVLNQMDLLDGPPLAQAPAGLRPLPFSALTGDGLPELQAALVELAHGLGPSEAGSEVVAINARHAQALEVATTSLAAAREKLAAGEAAELVASDIRGALAGFGEIAGKIDHERVLDHLFATFCIGK